MVDEIVVEVVYALPERQQVVTLTLPATATVEQALQASGLLQICPELDLATIKVGVFSQICSLQKVLQHDDRLEIYRPLAQDPKQARRSRV